MKYYELTDEEWNRISDLLPLETTGKRGRPTKDNHTMMNVLTARNVTALGKVFTAVSKNGLIEELLPDMINQPAFFRFHSTCINTYLVKIAKRNDFSNTL